MLAAKALKVFLPLYEIYPPVERQEKYFPAFVPCYLFVRGGLDRRFASRINSWNPHDSLSRRTGGDHSDREMERFKGC